MSADSRTTVEQVPRTVVYALSLMVVPPHKGVQHQTSWCWNRVTSHLQVNHRQSRGVVPSLYICSCFLYWTIDDTYDKNTDKWYARMHTHTLTWSVYERYHRTQLVLKHVTGWVLLVVVQTSSKLQRAVLVWRFYVKLRRVIDHLPWQRVVRPRVVRLHFGIFWEPYFEECLDLKPKRH